MTTKPEGARRSWVDRWLAVTDVNVSRRSRGRFVLMTAVLGWLAVSVWMVVQRDAPRWPGVMMLAVVLGVLGLSYLVTMLLGERPGGRVVLRWAALIAIVHLAVVTALLFTVVREPNRLGKAFDAVLIAPGFGFLFAGLGLIALAAVLGVPPGVRHHRNQARVVRAHDQHRVHRVVLPDRAGPPATAVDTAVAVTSRWP